MASKQAVKRIPKLKRMLRLLYACSRRALKYRGKTLAQAWPMADRNDRNWLAYWAKRGPVVCDNCPTCINHTKEWKTFNKNFGGLPQINTRKPLPAAWLKRWGGYEPVRKSAAKKAAKKK